MKIMSQEKDSQRGQTSGKQQSAIHPQPCTQTKFVLCVCPLFPIFRSHLANIISQYNSIDTRICRGSEDYWTRGPLISCYFKSNFSCGLIQKPKQRQKNLSFFFTVTQVVEWKEARCQKGIFVVSCPKKRGWKEGVRSLGGQPSISGLIIKKAQVNTCVLFWVGENHKSFGCQTSLSFPSDCPHIYWAASEQQKNWFRF
jgi:hypothetical protein